MNRSATTKRLENPVQLGVIGAAHGIRGEVKVRSFTADPLDLGAYGPLQAEDGRRFTVESVRAAGDAIVVRFVEVSDRSAAEKLSSIALFVERSVLPPELDEDEFYHADLIGMTALRKDGAELGTVVAVHDFGAGDVVEIRLLEGRSVMVPFTRAAVPQIDPGRRVLTVDPRAAGLDEEAAS